MDRPLEGAAEKMQDAERSIVQNGREVYKWAVTTVPKGMLAAAEKVGMSL